MPRFNFMRGKSMTKSMLAATLLMVFIVGIHAEQKSATADKAILADKSAQVNKSAMADKATPAAQSASVREMLSGVSEIGAILEDRHVVYEAATLQSNVLDAVIEAIDPEGGAILTKDQAM